MIFKCRNKRVCLSCSFLHLYDGSFSSCCSRLDTDSAMHGGRYCSVRDHRLHTMFQNALWETMSALYRGEFSYLQKTTTLHVINRDFRRRSCRLFLAVEHLSEAADALMVSLGRHEWEPVMLLVVFVFVL